jgi:hypothetical protein
MSIPEVYPRRAAVSDSGIAWQTARGPAARRVASVRRVPLVREYQARWILLILSDPTDWRCRRRLHGALRQINDFAILKRLSSKVW